MLKRSKTFTGCWTCRSRHVKCDENKPSCHRCRTAGITCEGYSHRFIWIAENGIEDPDNAGSTTSHRKTKRRTGLTVYPTSHQLRLPSATIAVWLSELEGVVPSHRCSRVRGPFCVFSTADHYALETVHEQRHDGLVNKHYGAPTFALATHPMPRRYRALMHHWATSLSGDIVAADGSDNMPRTVWTPIALTALQCNAPVSADYDACACLLHSICATAAHHLGILHQNDQRGPYATLALQHNQLALRHLRRYLSKRANVAPVSLTLMAILGCLVADTISGRVRGWRSHLWAGLQILQSAAPSSFSSCSHLPRLLLVFLSIVAVCGWALPSEMQTTLLSRVPPNESYLKERHGISHETLRLLLWANRIKPSQGQAQRLQQRDALDSRLTQLQSLPSELCSSAVAATKADLMSSAFHFATVIFAMRRLGFSSASDQIQAVANSAMDCLDAVEVSAGKGSMMIWPIMVTAAESCGNPVLQHRLSRILLKKQKVGFGHISKLVQLAKANLEGQGAVSQYFARGFLCSELLGSVYDVPPI
ncbi:Fungal Zn binuclear cluster domain containing protein [Cordyceps fumosorosea ARSEF 2679]|uniref:Fungal Zn binuclear cluster domain containing protein n=1 Tax=Cordyceps fumosorosea (strain ARSEF 2679) TaxID=1081104 RepID=A0A167DLF2_CORFA|nr:Fungal Zn binuclear cluster domain containing protein [Cordyceps fumosorosea ARSEF 2679]OAA42551.1 Fungal Zn binuclear cluster domain containing protein [Cordyceps fumosorosea ARSEF 2679]